MRRRTWAAIFVAGLGWGTEGVATRAAFEQNVGPYPVAVLRSVIAAVGSVGYLAIAGQLKAPNQILRRQAAVQGIAHMAGPFLLLTYAYQHASAGFVSLLVAMVPLATAAIAHFFLPDERLGARLITGFVIAAVGAGILIASGESGLAAGGQPLLGSVLAMAAVLLIAGSGVYAKRDAGRYDPAQLTALQMVVGALVLGAVVPFVDMQWSLSAQGWAIMLFLAVGATVIPYFAFFWAMGHASAMLVSLSGYVAPLVAVTVGWMVLDEQISLSIVVGGVLILIGVITADRAEKANPVLERQ